MRTKAKILFAGITMLVVALGIIGIRIPTHAEEQIVRYADTAGADLKNPDVIYEIYGNHGKTVHDTTKGSYFVVPKNSSSEANPITVILDEVWVTQEHSNPTKSWLTIETGNYVIVKLRGDNYIKAWSHDEVGSDDGMSPIHVSKGSTVKVTSEEGDGDTSGSLEAHGGGGKYGGAGIGTRYNEDTGTILIAGGTIKAYGGHSAAGIGSGRDGKATEIQITGGTIYAEGGEYAAGIGGGDNVSAGEGGDLVNLTITGGTVKAQGGAHAAGIGCSEGGSLEGLIRIENAEIEATGGTEAAGIGGGDGASFWDNGKIRIQSGTITATGGKEGAGIGGGEGTSGVKIEIDQTEGKELHITAAGGSGATGIGGGNGGCKSISMMLRGGKIYAVGGYHSAAIGAGNDAGSIEIRGTGTIEAYGGENGCGIGAGNDGELTGHITIEGATNGQYGTRGEAPEGSRLLTITAIASYGRVEEGDGYKYENEAAAIGSGKASCGDILVKNAVLYTKGDNQGADIGGGGYHINPRGTIKNITIDNCEIHSSSVHKVSPGIGAGYGGTVDHITITNTRYQGCGIGGTPMDMNYTDLNSVKSIRIENSDITAVWDQENPGKFVGGMTPTTSPEEHGAAGIGSGQYGAMDEITIKNSKVYAQGYGSGAGIGGGGVGGTGWSVLDLSKWSVGDTGTITITGSDVSAYSGKAHFDGHDPVVIYDGTVFIKIDNDEMFGGGAGIGGGSASDTTKIDIHDCGEIHAEGDGCGIGTGEGTGKISKGAVDYIWLENIETLTAKGGDNCAGIGTGGSEGGLGSLSYDDSGALTQIFIKNCKNLKAYGGSMAAGIGTGAGGSSYYYIKETEKGDWPLLIQDSTIYAQGGEGGAGIGGGFEREMTGKGGDCPRTLIKGKCRVIAIGGKEKLYEMDNGIHGGGAGIGGGSTGSANYVEIDLDEDYNCAGKGTMDFPERSNYYVKARGNGGGAGIGSGGCSWQLRNPMFDAPSSGSIIIKKGAVFAKGSDSVLCADPDHLDYGIFDMGDLVYTGAGAGIGGGSGGTKVDNVWISGGYIVAQAGTPTNEKDAADDIGSGGDFSDDTWYQFVIRDNKDLTIKDGTVLAETIGDFKGTVSITGGSVSAAVKHTGDVYRTKAKLLDPQEKVDSLKTSKSYGAAHIYSDPEGYVYLYLKKQGSESSHDQYADIEVNTAEHKNKWHYVGYTNEQHTGVLKLEGEEVPFTDPGEIARGHDFELSLEDDTLAGAEWTFAVQGAASISTSGGQSKSPGAYVKLHADAEGSYTVSGATPYSKDPERFWGSFASFTGTILIPSPSTVAIAGPASKTYDGQPAEGPEVETDSDGAITYLWYDANGTELSSAPVNAGHYQVAALTGETMHYQSGMSEKVDYTIFPKSTGLTQSAVTNGETVTITAEVTGLLTLPEGAKAYFTATTIEGTELDLSAKEVSITEEDGHFIARLSGTVSVGEYKVEVTANLNDSNYTDPAKSERTYHRDRDPRSLSAEDISVTYGADSATLTMTTNHPTDSDNYIYEISSDTAEELTQRLKEETGIDYEAEPTIAVESNSDQPGNNAATVTFRHAGTAVIKVTLESASVYDTAETYVRVNVRQKKLTVSSYAYAKNGDPDTVVRSVKYGSIDTLGFGLQYTGLANGDTPETFTHGFGTLEAVPLSETLSVSEEPYLINIMRKKSGDYPFYSRDYSLEFDTSQRVTVTKAKLAVQAQDAKAVYGEAAPELTWTVAEDQAAYECDGLASWDTERSIFKYGADVILDTTKTDGKEFPKINAGTYPDALTVEKAESRNYDIVYLTGTLTIEPANIEDNDRFSVNDLSSVVYNGTEQKQEVVLTDNALEPAGTLKKDTDYLLTYPEETSFVYAGKVKATLTGKGNYTGTREEDYEIFPCAVVVETESAEKLHDGTPLTAPGEASGIPDADAQKAVFTVTGSQTDAGSSANTWSLTFKNDTMKDSYYVIAKKTGQLTVRSNDLADFTLSKPENVVYNGCEQKQAVTVTDENGTLLTEGEDYTLTYSDAVNAGTVTVTARGTGAYTRTKAVTYKITPVSLKVSTKSASKVYDGEPLTAEGSVTGIVDADANRFRFKTTGTQTEPGTSKNTYELRFTAPAKAENYTITETLGTLTVKESKNTYYFAKNSDKSWTKGSKEGATLIVKRTVHDELTFGHYKKILVDGAAPGKKAFSVRQGSLVAEFTPEYLESLKAGKHTIQVFFDDGNDPKMTLSIRNDQNGGSSDDPVNPVNPDDPDNPDNPNHGNSPVDTGDDHSALLWIVLAIAALSAMMTAVTLMVRKRS